MKRILRIVRLWPIAAAVFFATLFNFWTVAGWLKAMEVSGRAYLIGNIIASQIEMLFWWWFFGWGPRMIRDADLVQELINDFKTEGFPREIRGLAEHAKWLAQRGWDLAKPRILKHGESDGEGKLHLWAARVKKSFAPVGYIMIYLLGSWPTVNVLIGVPLCRIVQDKLRLALLILMLGNINTVIANTALLESLIWLWHEHFWALVGIMFTVALAWLIRYRYTVQQKKGKE